MYGTAGGLDVRRPLELRMLKAGRDWLQPAVGNQGCLPLGLGVKGQRSKLGTVPAARRRRQSSCRRQHTNTEHIALLAHEPERRFRETTAGFAKPCRRHNGRSLSTRTWRRRGIFPQSAETGRHHQSRHHGLLRPGQTPIIRPVAKPLAQGPSRLSSDCPAQTNRPSCPLGILAVETGAVLQCPSNLSSKSKAKGPFPAY